MATFPFETDSGTDGARQWVIPGTEQISSTDLAKRRVAAPMRPSAIQQPCDIGLFSDDAAQTDLINFTTATERNSS